ncbi:uncharacterized protein LOC117330535 [Pecten maximus]|uniref:uncharacterized protein LOC117330535 n=1 Tax=Pecten maximus TaxID=6579 RepID=UPI0014585F86|nr:uncharacterized protein LOC117330535 [Pecten maximus]
MRQKYFPNKMFSQQVFILCALILTFSSASDLECGPKVQVLCSINKAEPEPDNYKWRVPACTHTSSENKEIGLKYSKPPDSLKGLRQFELRIYMNKTKLIDVALNNTNTETKCRFKNLESAEYSIRIRPINPIKCVCKFRDMCKICQTRKLDVQLKSLTDDNNTFHMGHTVSNYKTMKRTSPTGQDGDSTKDFSKKHVSPTLPTGTTTTHLEYTDSFHGLLLRKKELKDKRPGWHGPLMIVLLILLITITVVCVIYWRQRKRMSTSQGKSLKLCPNHIIDGFCETSKMSLKGIKDKDVSSPVCEKMDVSWTKTEEEDQDAYDSGFDSNKNWRERNVPADKCDMSKPGNDQISNCNSLCDVSDGAFIANSLIWADMDRYMSDSVCTIHSLSSENKGRQSSSKHFNCNKYTNPANSIGISSQITRVDKDIIQQQNICKYGYTNENACKSKRKYGNSGLFWKTSPLTLLTKKTRNFHNKMEISEQSRMLETVASEQQIEYPMSLSLNSAESAKTLNVFGEEEWKNNKYSNRPFRNSNHLKYEYNDDINDAISLGEISL